MIYREISQYSIVVSYVVSRFYRFYFICIVVDGSSALVGRHYEKRIRTARAG